MKESNFANEIKRACSLIPNCFYYKIPDAYNMERFSPKKPFDAIIISNGKPIAIEFKMIKEKKSFAFSNVREHQINGLMEFADAGGDAYVMVNYRGERLNETYGRGIQEYLTNVEHWSGGGRKSIPYNDLGDLCSDWFIVVRKKFNSKLNWDLSPIL